MDRSIMGRKRKEFVPPPPEDYTDTVWLTLPEISRRWGYHRSTIFNRRDELAWIKPGRDYLVSEKSVLRVWGNGKCTPR